MSASPHGPAADRTLHELAGGAAATDGIAARFYARTLTDPLLLPLFADPTEDHAGRMALFLAELLGGPSDHSAQRGGLPRMIGSHVGLGITEQQRQRWLDHMLAAVHEAELPQPVLDALVPYLVRGTHLARSTSATSTR